MQALGLGGEHELISFLPVFELAAPADQLVHGSIVLPLRELLAKQGTLLFSELLKLLHVVELKRVAEGEQFLDWLELLLVVLHRLPTVDLGQLALVLQIKALAVVEAGKLREQFGLRRDFKLFVEFPEAFKTLCQLVDD